MKLYRGGGSVEWLLANLPQLIRVSNRYCSYNPSLMQRFLSDTPRLQALTEDSLLLLLFIRFVSFSHTHRSSLLGFFVAPFFLRLYIAQRCPWSYLLCSTSAETSKPGSLDCHTIFQKTINHTIQLCYSSVPEYKSKPRIIWCHRVIRENFQNVVAVIGLIDEDVIESTQDGAKDFHRTGCRTLRVLLDYRLVVAGLIKWPLASMLCLGSSW